MSELTIRRTMSNSNRYWPVAIDLPGPYNLAAGLLLVATISVLVVVYFYDQFSYLPDDGTYAYIASRVLAGDVLNRDIQDVHAGYITFFNAAALKVFGSSLLSLRFPLMIVTVFQAILAFWFVRNAHIGLAILCGTVMASLTFVQFLNPTANWYCLFFVVVIILLIDSTAISSRSRLTLIGAMVGLVFLTRQLNGVMVGIAVLTYFVHEMSVHSKSDNTLATRIVLGPLIFVLAIYTWRATDLAGLLLIGIWPLLIGTYVTITARVSNQDVIRITSWLLVGALLASAPLVAYHVWHGSVEDFIDDVVVSAIALSNLEFIDQGHYLWYGLYSAVQIVSSASPTKIINGIFWLFLIIAPAILGTSIFALLMKGRKLPTGQPLVFVSVFYALVSVHYQIPIYLFYSTALTLIALLLISRLWRERFHALIIVLVALAVGVGLFYHAGQPLSRGIAGTLEGHRESRLPACPIAKAGLRLEKRQCEKYTRVLAMVDRYADSDDTILALPYGPEFYFLSGLNAPVRYINTAIGVRNETQLNETLATLLAAPPRLVIYRPDDKYNTQYSRRIADWVASRYELLDVFDGFEVYGWKSN